MQPALSLLKAVVDPSPAHRAAAREQLPPPLRDADRTLMFNLIRRLANAIDPEAATRPIDEPAERLRGLHDACQAIGCWPDGIEVVRWHPTTPRSAIRSICDSWSELPPASSAARSTSAPVNKPRSPAGPIRTRAAAQIARLTPEVLLEAWEHRLVTRHHRIYGTHTVPAFDPEEIREFGREWNERKDPETVARALAISYHGVEQMVALNVIAADARAFPTTGPHFTPNAIAEFLAAMARRAQPILRESVPLTETMTRIGGRPKPWGPIFKAMLEGDLRFGLRARQRLAKCIVIPASEADQVCSAKFDRSEHPDMYFQPRMNQRDALEMLNMTSTGAKVLHGLAFLGTNPKSYAVADVEKRAGEICSVPEIAANLMINPPAAYRRLKRMSLQEVIPGGWDRAILDKLA
jgi:hypothetical protein